MPEEPVPSPAVHLSLQAPAPAIAYKNIQQFRKRGKYAKVKGFEGYLSPAFGIAEAVGIIKLRQR